MRSKKRKRLLLCLSIALIVFTGLTAGGGVQLSTTALATPVTQTITVTLFGPQQFVRSTGKPEAVTQSFSVPPSVHAPFDLVVDNGDAAGGNRVSSAHILLNGAEVAGPSDFDQQVAHFDREVTVNASDTLTVQLEGKPGSILTISLTGKSDTVGALGGLITVTDPTSPIDGATVQIPAGALAQETSIMLSPLSLDDLQTAIGRTVPSSMRLAGGIVIDAGGTTFQKPATVSLPNTLGLGSGDQLLVGRLDPTLPAPANLIFQGFAQDGPIGFQIINDGSYAVLSPVTPLVLLHGQLVDSLHAPVSRALIVSVNPTLLSYVTDPAGGFTIPAGTPGTYGILAAQFGASAAVLGLPLPPSLPPTSIVDLLNQLILNQLDIEGSPFPPCPAGPAGSLQLRERPTTNGTLALAQGETVHTFVKVTSGIGAYFGTITPPPVENINGNFPQRVPTLPTLGSLDIYNSVQFAINPVTVARFDPALPGSGGALSEQGTLVGVSPAPQGVNPIETADVDVTELRSGAAPCRWSLSTASPVTVSSPVTATHLYWADFGHGTIMKGNLDGTSPQTLVTGQSAPAGVAVDSSHIYWANNFSGPAGTILTASPDGSGEKFLAGGQILAGVAVDSSHIYWADWGDGAIGHGTIKEANLDGTGVTTLVTGQTDPEGVAVDSSHIYWANGDGTIKAASLNGPGTATTLVTGLNAPIGVAVDNSHIYWADNHNGTIMEADLGGGGVTTLVTGQVSPWGVAVDSGHIYWTDAGGFAIRKANLDGTGVTTIVQAPSSGPTWLAVGP